MSNTSDFRVEKRRAEAEITLATGLSVKGCFFLAGQSATHAGPERIGDLLNGPAEFFPFELEDGTTALFNRAHIVTVALPAGTIEPQLDPGYAVATKRQVAMVLATGQRIDGIVAVDRPLGRNRLSDYMRSEEAFRYLETTDRTFIINCAHIVELMEIGE